MERINKSTIDKECQEVINLVTDITTRTKEYIDDLEQQLRKSRKRRQELERENDALCEKKLSAFTTTTTASRSLVAAFGGTVVECPMETVASIPRHFRLAAAVALTARGDSLLWDAFRKALVKTMGKLTMEPLVTAALRKIKAEDVLDAWRCQDDDEIGSIRFCTASPLALLDALDYLGAALWYANHDGGIIATLDISGGLERFPIAVIDSYGRNQVPSQRYITAYEDMSSDTPPVPHTQPHDSIVQRNNGIVPYIENRLAYRGRPPALVYECNCPLGLMCPFAVTQRGMDYRLEIFRTKRCGWGVRTLDPIPKFAFVCTYFGQLFGVAAYEALVKDGRKTVYSMDMGPRNQAEKEFVVCGLDACNVAAFFNHSCRPNMFVQPVSTTHRDLRRPQISLFAAADIEAMTELTWDYGQKYDFRKGCKCHVCKPM